MVINRFSSEDPPKNTKKVIATFSRSSNLVSEILQYWEKKELWDHDFYILNFGLYNFRIARLCLANSSYILYQVIYVNWINFSTVHAVLGTLICTIIPWNEQLELSLCLDGYCYLNSRTTATDLNVMLDTAGLERV